MRWRDTVSALLMLSLTVSVLLSALSFGLLPVHPGFASKDEFRMIQASRLERDLIDIRKNQCNAILSGNNEAINYLSLKMREWRAEYLEVTGNNTTLPTCREVGVDITLAEVVESDFARQ
mgnify:CR=1 FL=1